MIKITYLFFIMTIILGCGGAPTYNDPIPTHDNFTIKSNIVNETRVINV